MGETRETKLCFLMRNILEIFHNIVEFNVLLKHAQNWTFFLVFLYRFIFGLYVC